MNTNSVIPNMASQARFFRKSRRSCRGSETWSAMGSTRSLTLKNVMTKKTTATTA